MRKEIRLISGPCDERAINESYPDTLAINES